MVTLLEGGNKKPPTLHRSTHYSAGSQLNVPHSPASLCITRLKPPCRKQYLSNLSTDATSRQEGTRLRWLEKDATKMLRSTSNSLTCRKEGARGLQTQLLLEEPQGPTPAADRVVAGTFRGRIPREAAGTLLNSAIAGNMGEGRQRNARVGTHTDFINEKPAKYPLAWGSCGKERSPRTGQILFSRFLTGIYWSTHGCVVVFGDD